jgi:NitT/TauT family transport system substrate-binding protein
MRSGRVNLSIVVAAITLCGVATACSSSGSGSGGGTAASLRLDWLPTGYQAVYYYGKSLGYYTKAGINLSIEDGKGSSSTIQAVAAGKDTFGLAAVPVLAQAATSVNDVKVICGVVEKTPNAIIALSSSGITKPSDLTGKTQGYTPGGETVPATAFESVNGVDPSSVKKVGVAAGAEVPALLTHKVDFINEWAFDEGLQVKEKDPNATILPFADNGVDVMGSGIIVNTSTIKDKASLVQNFVSATQKAMKATAANPKAAYDAFVKARPTAPDISLENLKESILYYHSQSTQGQPDCSMSTADIQGTQTILSKYAGLPASVKVASLIDTQFIGGSGS